MIQNSQVDLTPIIESRQYLEKCIQEIDYLLQSSNIAPGNNSGPHDNDQHLSDLQQESLNTNFNQISQQQQQPKPKPSPAKKRQQMQKKEKQPENDSIPKTYHWVASEKLAGQMDNVRALAFIDSDNLLTGSDDGTITQWKLDFDRENTTATLMQIHRSHTGPVVDICYDSVTNTFYSGGEDQFIRRWSPEQSMEIGSILAHQGFIMSMAIDEETRSLASVSSDGAVHIWNIANPDDMILFAGLDYNSTLYADGREEQEGSTKAKESKKKGKKIDGDFDDAAEETETEEEEDDKFKEQSNSRTIPSATCVTFITGTRQVAVGYENSTIVIYDYRECVKVHELRIPGLNYRGKNNNEEAEEDEDEQRHFDRTVASIVFSTKFNQIIASYEDGDIRVFDVNTGECVHAWNAHDGAICSIALLEGDESLMTSGSDDILKIWSFKPKPGLTKTGGKGEKGKKLKKSEEERSENNTNTSNYEWACVEAFDKQQSFKTQGFLTPLVAYRPSAFGTSSSPYMVQNIRKKPEEDMWSQGLIACASGDGGIRLYMNCETEEDA